MSNLVYPVVRGLTWNVTKTPKFSTIVQTSPGLISETRILQTQNPQWHWQLNYDYLKNDPSHPGPFTPYTDYQKLEGFILGRQGQYDSFLYDDPTDDTVTNQVLSLVTDGFGNFYSPIQRNFGGQFMEDITDLNPIDATGLVVKANGVTKTLGTDYTVIGPGVGIPSYSWRGLVIAWKGSTWGAWSPIFSYSTNATIIDHAGHIQKATTGGVSGSTIPTFNDAGSTTTDGTVTWTDQGLSLGPTGPITASFGFYFRVRFESDDFDIEQFMTFLWTIGGSSAKSGKGYLQLVSAPPDAPFVPGTAMTVGPSIIRSGTPTVTFLGGATDQWSQPDNVPDAAIPTNVTVTIPGAALASGDLIVVHIELIQKWNTGTLSVSNLIADTFAQGISVASSGGNQSVDIYTAISAGGVGANTISVTHSLAKNLRVIATAYRSSTGFGATIGGYGGNGTGWSSGTPSSLSLFPTAPYTLYATCSGWQGVGTFVMYADGVEGPNWALRLQNTLDKAPPIGGGPIGNGAIACWDRLVTVPSGDFAIDTTGSVGNPLTDYTASYITAGVAFPLN